MFGSFHLPMGAHVMRESAFLSRPSINSSCSIVLFPYVIHHISISFFEVLQPAPTCLKLFIFADLLCFFLDICSSDASASLCPYYYPIFEVFFFLSCEGGRIYAEIMVTIGLLHSHFLLIKLNLFSFCFIGQSGKGAMMDVRQSFYGCWGQHAHDHRVDVFFCVEW